jgi:hypothetical protein
VGAYKQMPYEEISEAEYDRRVSLLGPLELSSGGVSTSYADRTIDRFCDGDTCENPGVIGGKNGTTSTTIEHTQSDGAV